MYTMNVYNRVIPNFATETLIVLTIGVAFIYLFDALFKMARVYILETMGKRIGSILEEEILKRLMLLQTEHDRLLAWIKSQFISRSGTSTRFLCQKVFHWRLIYRSLS